MSVYNHAAFLRRHEPNEKDALKFSDKPSNAFDIFNENET